MVPNQRLPFAIFKYFNDKIANLYVSRIKTANYRLPLLVCFLVPLANAVEILTKAVEDIKSNLKK